MTVIIYNLTSITLPELYFFKPLLNTKKASSVLIIANPTKNNRLYMLKFKIICDGIKPITAAGTIEYNIIFIVLLKIVIGYVPNVIIDLFIEFAMASPLFI